MDIMKVRYIKRLIGAVCCILLLGVCHFFSNRDNRESSAYIKALAITKTMNEDAFRYTYLILKALGISSNDCYISCAYGHPADPATTINKNPVDYYKFSALLISGEKLCSSESIKVCINDNEFETEAKVIMLTECLYQLEYILPAKALQERFYVSIKCANGEKKRYRIFWDLQVYFPIMLMDSLD